MARASTADFYGSPVRIPDYGGYDLNPFAIRVAEAVMAAGDTDGTPGAASDTDADILLDTSTDAPLFNIELDSDQAGILGIWVMQVLPVVVTAFTASVDLSLGDTSNTSLWATETAIGATSTDAGMGAGSDDYDDDNFPANNNGGVFHNSTMSEIEITVANAAPAVGRVAVYAAYFRCGKPGGSA